MYSYVNVII